jgi:hypothetical protein
MFPRRRCGSDIAEVSALEQVELVPAALTRAAAGSRVRAYAWIAGWWLAGRGVVLATAAVVHVLGPAGWVGHLQRTHALGVLEAWDGRWYRMVASSGYLLVPGRQSDPAFFPLLPALLRAGHAAGLGYSTTGLLLGNAGFLVALLAFYLLSRELLGEEIGRRATTYLAVFPFGYVFSMVYPQSLVLALIALAALAALRGRGPAAAVCAAAATLGRPEGLCLALPLLAIAWRQWAALTPARRGVALAAVLAPAAALGSFSFYLGRTVHDPLAWSKAERAWGRHFSPLGLVHAAGGLGGAFAHDAWVVRDVAAVVVYLLLIAAAARAGVAWPWLASGAAIVVLPLFSGSFDSAGRFGLLAPAPFWGLAALGRSPAVDRLVLGTSLVLLVGSVVTLPLVFP